VDAPKRVPTTTILPFTPGPGLSGANGHQVKLLREVRFLVNCADEWNPSESSFSASARCYGALPDTRRGCVACVAQPVAAMHPLCECSAYPVCCRQEVPP
jgi:hypothetical protein